MKYQAVIYANIFVDDYNLGEGEEVNFWTQTLSAKTPKELLGELENYIPKNAVANMEQANLNDYDDSNEYFTSYLVDNDNNEPSRIELEQWEKGEIKLYVTNCQVLVSKVTNSKALLPKIRIGV